ncbi:MAG: right-handed parallel beta-helix repeat-containing protein [Desulfomonilaceae bacterium]
MSIRISLYIKFGTWGRKSLQTPWPWAITFLLFVLLTMCLPPFLTQASATTYHVDVNTGNDNYTGSEAEPFKTIKKAGDIMEAGDKTLIHEGVYHEQILGGKSGLPNKPITYEGVERDRVILRGSVTVKDWKKVGKVWFKVGLRPIQKNLAFVMVDEKTKLKQVASPQEITEGSFCLDSNNNYYIRLQGDKDPNTEHVVDVYELDCGFFSGDEYGGTSKKHIVLRNLTIEKYGGQGVSTNQGQVEQNSHWELDNVKVQYNQENGVFCALDDWYIHNCQFLRNRCAGCQINGARVRFIDNLSSENSYFGYCEWGGHGLIIGPNAVAHSCEIKGNTFRGSLFGIYFEGLSHNNVVEENFLEDNIEIGVGFFGGSYNRVFNNVLVNIAPKNFWERSAAFVIYHSPYGAPTQSVGNFIAFNTVWGCAAPVAIPDPNRAIKPDELNQLFNNVFSNCRHMLPKPKTKVATLSHNAWFNCPEEEDRSEQSLKNSLKRVFEKTLISGIDTLDTHPIRGKDPMFKNVLHNDFIPLPNSPLVHAGMPIDSITTDIRGVSRPKDSNPNIGAYEFNQGLNPGQKVH